MNNIYLRHAYPNELYHWGIKGQRWGVRRFQNPDGSLTPAGRKRYLNESGSMTRRGRKASSKSEEIKAAIKNEQMRNSPYSEYKKAGFKDTTPDLQRVSNVQKEIKIGDRDVTVGTTLKSGSESNVTVAEMNRFVKNIGVNDDHIYYQILNNANRFDIGIGITGKPPTPSKPNDFRITKSGPNENPIGECSCDIKDIDGEYFGYLTVRFDPENGKLTKMSFNV